MWGSLRLIFSQAKARGQARGNRRHLNPYALGLSGAAGRSRTFILKAITYD
jgi:hypothetical protein